MIDENQNKSKKKSWNLILTSLGWELAIPIFGGVFLGYQIDRRLINSGYGFTIGLLILGIFIGYYNLYKHIELEVLITKWSKLKEKNKPED